MRLIGLIGQARVGKDTVAAHLYRQHDFEQTSFAYRMKLMLQAAFPDVNFNGGDREQPIGWLGKSPRHLMQTLGTEWGRNCIHPDLWTMLTARDIAAARSNNFGGLVVTDVRFHNEANMILAQGGELWHVLRDDAPKVAAHESELYDWANFPRRIIANDGTLDELYAQVDALMVTACSD